MSISVEHILTNPPPGVDLTLVGGQALTFWTALAIQRYPELFPDDVISSTYDIDFVVQLKEACKACHDHWGGDLRETTSMDDHTPELGIINISEGDETITIDLLDGLLSMNYDEICKYRRSLAGSDPLFQDMYILSEWGVLLNRVYNSCSIARYRNPEAIRQLRNAVAINAAFIRAKIDDGNIPQAQAHCHKIAELAGNKFGLEVFLTCKVDLLEALPQSFDGFTAVKEGLGALIEKVDKRREVRLAEIERRKQARP